MIHLVLKQNVWAKDDVQRMRKALNAAGYDADLRTIEVAFENFSEDVYAAGWMSIGGFSDESLVSALLQYLEPDATAKGSHDL